MSESWSHDMREMHAKYGVYDIVKKWISEGNRESLLSLLDFRVGFLKEELNETIGCYDKDSGVTDADGLVDGLIDLIVVAIGTLDLFEIDSNVAWNRVLEANMNKVVGVNPNRPNPLGLPDLYKPEGWKAPSHEDNVGLLKLLEI